MKTKIKEVSDYFKAKLLSGDFEIVELDKYTVKVLVDESYEFNIWIGNRDIKDSRELYDGRYNFIAVDFNQKERIKLHSILKKPVDKFYDDNVRNEKIKQYEELKKELNIK